MERKEGFAETTQKLLSLGAKDTPSYLQTAFGANSDTAGVVVHEVGALALDDEPIHGGDGIDPPAVEMNTIEAEGKVAGEVPFYTKVRGKGKGQPVLYDTSRSSVAQIYELAAQLDLPEPVFSYTSSGAAHLPSFSVQVTFNGLSATHTAFASSFKQGKQLACDQLIAQILLQKRTANHLAV